MQIVHVLSAEEEAITQFAFQLCQRIVCGIRLGFGSSLAAQRIKAPHALRIVLPTARRCDIFDALALPKSIGTAKRCQSAFGAHACSGEHENTILVVNGNPLCSHLDSYLSLPEDPSTALPATPPDVRAQMASHGRRDRCVLRAECRAA